MSNATLGETVHIPTLPLLSVNIHLTLLTSSFHFANVNLSQLCAVNVLSHAKYVVA